MHDDNHTGVNTTGGWGGGGGNGVVPTKKNKPAQVNGSPRKRNLKRWVLWCKGSDVFEQGE